MKLNRAHAEDPVRIARSHAGNATVTSGTTTHELEAPFLVMATQKSDRKWKARIRFRKAQLDRFLMKILVTYPSRADLSQIVGAHHSKGRDPTVSSYSARGWHPAASRGMPPGFGRSARAAIRSRSRYGHTGPALDGAHDPGESLHPVTAVPHAAHRRWWNAAAFHALMHGRFNLSTDDLRTVANAVLRHRIILNFERARGWAEPGYLAAQDRSERKWPPRP